MTMTTGNIIKYVRRKHGLTQTELGNILGVKLSAIQKYENGSIQNLKIDTIRKFCTHFQIPPLFFLFPEHVDWDEVDASGESILDALAKMNILNKDGERKLIEYLNDLALIEKYQRTFNDNP